MKTQINNHKINKYEMKQITLMLIFLLSASGIFAQNGTFSGNIYDQVTGKSISEAIIKVSDRQTLTDASGNFNLTNIPQGSYQLVINALGYDSYETNITISSSPLFLKIPLIPKSISENERRGITEININELDLGDDSKGQAVSGLLHSSGDVFTSTSSYTLGAMYFRMRGYDSENYSVYMGGINVNDAENGRTIWSEWGGLNDATRNKEVVNGIASSRFSFGNLGGVTNIITRASLQRKQTKFTYSLSNKSYTNRAMFTYSTGLMDNNWAFTVSGSRRWGEGGYIDGVFYDAWAYFVSVEKKINNKHSIAFTGFGSPTKRGQQGGATQETYDLVGSNYYNPNWGYQDGKKRNSRVKDFHEPMMILAHYWDIDRKTRLTSSLGYSFGYNGGTALNWYNAADPRPDYYRYLPSYQTDPYIKNLVTQSWLNNPEVSQINWDKLYQANYLANATGTQAKYILEDRRNDQQQFSVNILLNKEITSNVKFDGGLEYRKYRGHHFKTIADLLGGKYWVDIDQFAERDFQGDTIKNQNDLNNPNRIVKEGDTYGYDYYIYSNTGQLWGQMDVTLDKVDYYISGSVSNTTFWRHGNMKNGRYPDNSYGDSPERNFVTGGVKAGATYKFSGRHFLIGNAMYLTRAPFVYNSFVSPRTRGQYVNDLKQEKIISGDLNYILRTPQMKARLTIYHTMFYDQSEVTSFYHDDYKTFVNYALTGINKVHQGIEFGSEVKVSPTISVSAVAALGNFRYTNNPNSIISYDNGSKPDTTQIVYSKSFYVNGTPQTAGSIGLNYRHPKYWFFNANFNYFGKMYLDFNPERRTSAALSNMSPDDPRIPDIINQIKLDDGFTLDASIGKSWQINKTNINLNFSVTNILDNTKLITGGYEQMRFDYDNKNINKFPPKYFYGFGRTFFLNLGIRL